MLTSLPIHTDAQMARTNGIIWPGHKPKNHFLRNSLIHPNLLFAPRRHLTRQVFELKMECDYLSVNKTKQTNKKKRKEKKREKKGLKGHLPPDPKANLYCNLPLF